MSDAPKDLSDVFAAYQPPEGAWKCSSCLVWNKPAAVQCACCEEPKPGVTLPKAGNGAAAAAGFGTLFGAPSSSSSGGGGGFALNIDAGDTSSAPAASAGGFQLNLGGGDAGGGSGGFQLNLGGGDAGGGSGGFQLNLGGGGAGSASAPMQPGSGFQFGSRRIIDADQLRVYFAEAASTDAPGVALSDELSSLPSSRAVDASSLGGSTFVFGSGDCDQLGLGDEGDLAERPTFVPGVVESTTATGKKKKTKTKSKSKKAGETAGVAAVAVGGLHTAVVTTRGQLVTWGCNDDKVLGREGQENLPAPVTGLLGGAFVTAISCGDSHMAAITRDGDVFAWGTYKGAEGYIGFAAGVKRQATPLRLDGVARYGRACRVSCGADHTAVVTTDGVAVAWGNGEQGQLGRRVVSCSLRGSRTKHLLLTPNRLMVGPGRRGEQVRDVFCGGYHTFAITRGGDLYATGLNNYGQLGLGDNESRFKAEKVDAFGELQVARVAGGLHHTVALTTDGRVFTWGRGDSGQLGLVNREAPVSACSWVPLQLPPSAFNGEAVRLLETGSSHSVAVTTSGRLYTWGYGDMYQLGNADMKDEPVPYQVPWDETERAIFCVGAGGQHTAVLAADAKKYAQWVAHPPVPARDHSLRSKRPRGSSKGTGRSTKRSRR